MAVSTRKLIRTGRRQDMFDGLGQYQYDKTLMRPKDPSWRKAKTEVDIPKILSVFLSNNGKLKRNTYIIRRSEQKSLDVIISDLRHLFNIHSDPTDIWKLSDLNGRDVTTAKDLYMGDASSFILSRVSQSLPSVIDKSATGLSLSFNGVVQGRLKSATGANAIRKSSRRQTGLGWMYGKSNLRLKSGLKPKTNGKPAVPSEEPTVLQVDSKEVSKEILDRHLKKKAEDRETQAAEKEAAPEKPESSETDATVIRQTSAPDKKDEAKKINFDVDEFLKGNWAEAEKHLEELIKSETSEDLWADVESTGTAGHTRSVKPKGLGRINRRLQRAQVTSETSDFGEDFFSRFGQPPTVVQRSSNAKVFFGGDPFAGSEELKRSGSAVRNWIVPLVTPPPTNVTVAPVKPRGRIGRLMRAKIETEQVERPKEESEKVEPIESRSYEVLETTRTDTDSSLKEISGTDKNISRTKILALESVEELTPTVTHGTDQQETVNYSTVGSEEVDKIGEMPIPTHSPTTDVEVKLLELE